MADAIHDPATAIEALERIRSACPALHAVYLPNNLWPKFKLWHQRQDYVAWHRSIFILALNRGHLGRLTSPIHRYLIHGGALNPNISRQYIKDLPERWMYYTDALKRHRASKRHSGRVAELQCAEWLEILGWKIVGLEALRPGSDIEAKSETGLFTAFEVKFIGDEDDDFRIILHSMANGPSASTVSPYTACNFLLFRIYEASRQLVYYNGQRIAVVVIDDPTWWRFEFPLNDRWILRNNYEFFSDDTEWEKFMGRQKKCPSTADLHDALRQIDAAWILRRARGYTFQLEHKLKTTAI
jgi:hypothetical protein